jgi:prepilin-type processing-associated H-X9-DG protein
LALITWGKTLEATNYAGVSGSAAARNDTQQVLSDSSFTGATNADGVLYFLSKTKLKEVTDGTSNTFIVGERWYQVRSWLQGGRANSLDNPTTQTLYSCKNIDFAIPPNGEFNAGYYVSHNQFRGEMDEVQPGLQTIGLNDLYWSSMHPSGLNFTFVDGSVHFVSEDVDEVTWEAYGSRNGGETGIQALP